MCSGVKPTGCDSQHVSKVSIKSVSQTQLDYVLRLTQVCVLQYCIGGGGFFLEPLHCGDFTALQWTSDKTKSASKEMVESAVLLFYR